MARQRIGAMTTWAGIALVSLWMLKRRLRPASDCACGDGCRNSYGTGSADVDNYLFVSSQGNADGDPLAITWVYLRRNYFDVGQPMVTHF
jgi:hypothetical protein